MSRFQVNVGSAKVMTATGQVTPCSGALIGFQVNSTNAGTLTILDGGAFGTALSGTITPAIGYHAFPATFDNGLYVGIGGTALNVTFFFVGQSPGGTGGAEPTPSFFLPLSDDGNGAVNLTPNIGVGAATFTRATTATTVDSTGTIISVASGVARSYYDPTTLQYMGYLAEPARANLCFSSNDFRSAAAGNPVTWWTNSQCTVTADATASPDGTVNADKLVEDSATSQHGVFSATFSITSGTSYTYSVWAKSSERTAVGIQVNSAGNWSASPNSVFNLATGAITSSANSLATITAYSGGWYRCTITGEATSTTTERIFININGNTSYLGDGASGIFVYGAQVEAGTYPSTYIPTTVSAETRNADVLTYTFAGNADATVGTAYAELSTFWSAASGAANMAIGFDNAAVGPLRVNNALPTVINIADGTTSTVTKTGLTSMATGVRKRASNWGGSTMAVTGDGATVQSGVFDGNLSSSAIAIGCDTAGGRGWGGTIKNATIWPPQFTAAQLQAVTS